MRIARTIPDDSLPYERPGESLYEKESREAEEILSRIPKTIGKGKRPRDPNQLAKWIVDRSTIEPPTELIAPDKSASPVDLSSYMAAIGRKGGQIGGKRRLKTMTKAERSKVAAKGAKARWSKLK